MDDLIKYIFSLAIITAGAIWLWATAPKGTNKKYIIFFAISGIIAGIAYIIGDIFHIVEMGLVIIISLIIFFLFVVKAILSYHKASKVK